MTITRINKEKCDVNFYLYVLCVFEGYIYGIYYAICIYRVESDIDQRGGLLLIAELFNIDVLQLINHLGCCRCGHVC